MKIFISWSGAASHQMAKALKEWLPNVFQAVDAEDVFLSSSDVALGAQWFHELARVLDESDFGILCLTPESARAPWLLYEAGAIAKRLANSRVAPLLIGLREDELTSPLSHFQGALLDHDGAARLLASINDQLGDDKLSERKLSDAFKAWWPQIEPSVASASALASASAEPVHVYDVFLSAPMAAFESDATYVAARTEIKKVFNTLTQDCGMRVYWAGEKIEHMSDFDTIDVSVLDDVQALQQSRCFLMIYPQKLATSALFEAGYALALGCPSHYFVRERQDLPFLLRELPGVVRNVHIHEPSDWKDFDDLARKLKKNKDHWFPR